MSQKITRFEVIDDTGRAYVREGVSVLIDYQDEGKTLKVFVKKAAPLVRKLNWSAGDNQRKGAVKTRSQIKNPITGTWTKRDDKSGKFIDVKADPRPFKGVRKEKKRWPRSPVTVAR